MSAARRIRRGCGFTGWTSKYWLTGLRELLDGRGREARRRVEVVLGYHTRPFLPAGSGYPRSSCSRCSNWLPLVAFFVAYFAATDIYVATAVLMGAMALLLAGGLRAHARASRRCTRSVPCSFPVRRRHAHSAQSALHPVETYGVLLAAERRSPGQHVDRQAASGAAPAGPALEGQVQVSDTHLAPAQPAVGGVLRRCSACANLLVAFNTSEATWVNFKVFGLTARRSCSRVRRSRGCCGGAPRQPPPRRPDMTAERISRIRAALERELAPAAARHRGRQREARRPRRRPRRRALPRALVAEAFRGKSAIQRHRLVFAAVAGLMGRTSTRSTSMPGRRKKIPDIYS